MGSRSAIVSADENLKTIFGDTSMQDVPTHYFWSIHYDYGCPKTKIRLVSQHDEVVTIQIKDAHYGTAYKGLVNVDGKNFTIRAIARKSDQGVFDGYVCSRSRKIVFSVKDARGKLTGIVRTPTREITFTSEGCGSAREVSFQLPNRQLAVHFDVLPRFRDLFRGKPEGVVVGQLSGVTINAEVLECMLVYAFLYRAFEESRYSC